MAARFLPVPVDAWPVSGLPPARVERLLKGLPGEEVISQIATEANKAVRDCRLFVRWNPVCNDNPGCERIEAVIPIAPELLDIFFNSRSGYRAQYLHSAQVGDAFNRAVVTALLPHIEFAVSATSELGVSPQRVMASASGRHSKVWITNDWAAVSGLDPALMVPQWCRVADEGGSGLRAPVDHCEGIDFKGTWLAPESAPWLPASKQGRACSIHRTGWT